MELSLRGGNTFQKRHDQNQRERSLSEATKTKAMRVLIWGIAGRLGAAVLEAVNKTENAICVGGVDRTAVKNLGVPVFTRPEDISVAADVIIDFSAAECVQKLIPYAVSAKLPVVICTTGHTQKHLSLIEQASSSIPVFKSANVSMGVALLVELAKTAARAVGGKYDIEIIEQHHNVKRDAPSGTALMLAEALTGEINAPRELTHGRYGRTAARKPSEIGIHAVRGGSVVGKHEIIFFGKDESISIKHEASSKMQFAEGAVTAAQFLVDKPPAVYGMIDLIGSVRTL